MLYSNSNVDRAFVPERQPATGASGTGAGQSAQAHDQQTVKIPVLGKTLLFRGELTAEEDVILQGRVEGSIRHARNLIIGTDGSVLGDVYASHLTVEGLVEGDLYCSEAVLVRATAQVRGNIYAPRVGIMEGATFNGRVDMDPSAAATQQGNSRQSAKPPQPAPQRPTSGPPAAQGRTGTAAGAAATTRASPGSGSASTQGSGAGPGGSGGGPLASAAVDEMLGSQTSTRK